MDPPPKGRAQAAIEDGFAASSRVVVAAAIIMFGVFAAFVPEGEGPIKEIGLGLAVGVFVDAFLVRMTLVPAVLALLGDKAWWLPRWLDRRLPSFDVEGEGLMHQVSLADWPTPDDKHLVYAEDVAIGSSRVALAARPGEITVVESDSDTEASAFLLTLAGRMKIAGGRAKVVGLVLPEQAGLVRRRTGYLDCLTSNDLRRDLAMIAKAQPGLVLADHADRLTNPDDRAALGSFLARCSGAVVAVRDQRSFAELLSRPFSAVSMNAAAIDAEATPQNEASHSADQPDATTYPEYADLRQGH